MTDSPVVALNHAVAVSMTEGPAAALALVDTIVGLDSYHLLHTTRVEFFTRLGRDGDAAEAYRRALPLALNLTERRFIEGRLGRRLRHQTDRRPDRDLTADPTAT